MGAADRDHRVSCWPCSPSPCWPACSSPVTSTRSACTASSGSCSRSVALVVIGVALAYVLGGRGRLWVLPVSVLLFLAVGFQIGAGYARQLELHIPLGVAIVTTSVLLAALGVDAVGGPAAGHPVSAPGSRVAASSVSSAAAAALTALSGCSLGSATGSTGEQLVSRMPLPEPFRVPLPVPPVARPVGVHPSGADLYRVTQRVAEVEILPGMRTPILGYDGIFPGPTFETRRGRPVVVQHRNELPVPTVVHLHGGHTPAESDGWPLDLVLPVGDTSDWIGATAWSGTPNRPRASGSTTIRRTSGRRRSGTTTTGWTSPPRPSTAGSPASTSCATTSRTRCPLPRGDRELPLMICDRSFAADGSFAYPGLDQGMRSLPGVEDDWMEGVLGDVVLVNGAPWPVHEVDAARYRLRLLNASNARRYRLALTVPGAPDLPLVQIGSDSGLLAAPVDAPGDRDRAGRAVRRGRRLLGAPGGHRGDDDQRARHGPHRATSCGSAWSAPPPTTAGCPSGSRRSSRSCRRRARRSGRSGSPAARSATTAAGRSTARPSTRARRSPTSPSGRWRSGGSSPTCTTPCTSTSTRSRCCAAARGPRTLRRRVEGHSGPAAR